MKKKFSESLKVKTVPVLDEHTFYCFPDRCNKQCTVFDVCVMILFFYHAQILVVLLLIHFTLFQKSYGFLQTFFERRRHYVL